MLKRYCKDLLFLGGIFGTIFFLGWAQTPGDGAVSGGQIAIYRDDDQVGIQFEGRLETASSIEGPWVELVSGESPFVIQPSESMAFFRVVSDSELGVFDSQDVTNLGLEGPFQKHFDLAFAGVPDGIFPPVREKPYFEGRLSYEGLELPVRMRVRGNSSLQECPFPKLKVKVSGKVREGTPFEDAREWKIGSHCAEGGQGNIGRLRHERATFREAVVYEAMQILGFLSPRVRRVHITYQDTSELGNPDQTGWSLTRMGFMFDHVEVLAEGLNGRALDDEEVAALSDAKFPPMLIAELQLFHALIGNWDYVLSVDGKGLWNTEVVEMPDKSLIPLAGDFDLSSWVTGTVRVMAPRDYLPALEDIERHFRFELDRIRTAFGVDMFSNATQRFLGLREALENRIALAEVDEEGREFMRQHVAMFYDLIAQDGKGF